MTPDDATRVFRRAALAHREIEASQRSGSTDVNRRNWREALAQQRERARPHLRRLRRLYGITGRGNVFALHATDTRFCQSFLESMSVELGTQALGRMQSVHRTIWNRYLHETEGQAHRLLDFARALSAWLVYKAGAPFAMLEEDEAQWRTSPLGVPPEPGRVPIRRPALPGGVRDDGQSDEMTVDEAMDAGVPLPENPEPGTPLGLDLPGRFRAWGNPNADHAHFPLTQMGVRDANELKRRLLAPELGGHPILLMFEQRLGERLPMSPADMYLSLRKPSAERNRDLLRMIRKVEQFLYEGLQTYERNLRERDWEELRPLLVSTTHLMFPESTPNSPEQKYSELLISRVIGWTPRQIFQAAAFGVSIGIGILLAAPTLGGSLGLSTAALTTAMAAFEVASVAVSIGIAIDQYSERTRSNRFAAIDEGLRVASSTDNLHWDVVIDVFMLIVPPVAGAGVRAARNAWLRRALRNLPAEAVADVTTPAARRAARRRAAAGTGTDDTGVTAANPTPDGVNGVSRAGADQGAGPPRPPDDPPPGGRGGGDGDGPGSGQGGSGPPPDVDPFANLLSRQRRAISRLRSALTGSRQVRIPEETVLEYIRYFMSHGHSIDEAIVLANRWANIQRNLGRLGVADLPDPRDLGPMRRYFEQFEGTVEEALTHAESRIAIRMDTQSELPPQGTDQARAREAAGPRRAPRPTPAMRNAEGLVEYGGTDLSQEVIARRAAAQDTGMRNYAAVEFVDPDGDIRVFVLPSQRGVAHSEPRLIEALRNAGIDPSRILRLYTERSPCVQQAHCSAYLRGVLPDQAKVTWSFDFETDAEVADAIQAGLRREANRDLRRAVRPGSVTNPRTDVFVDE